VIVQVKDIHAANTCKVTPAKFSGSKEIVPLHKQKNVSSKSLFPTRACCAFISLLGVTECVVRGFVQVASTSAAGETEEIYFDFRKQRFIYSAEKDNFLKLRYPTKELIGHYGKGTGYGTEAKISTAVDKWGRNV
jgi:manganese-transporting P-type ATPase